MMLFLMSGPSSLDDANLLIKNKIEFLIHSLIRLSTSQRLTEMEFHNAILVSTKVATQLGHHHR